MKAEPGPGTREDPTRSRCRAPLGQGRLREPGPGCEKGMGMSLERFLRCPALNGDQDGWKMSPWLGNGLWIIPGPAPRSHRDGPGEGIRLPGASRAAGTSFQRHSRAKRGKSGSGLCPRCCSLRRDAPDAGNSWSAGMGLDGIPWIPPGLPAPPWANPFVGAVPASRGPSWFLWDHLSLCSAPLSFLNPDFHKIPNSCG